MEKRKAREFSREFKVAAVVRMNHRTPIATAKARHTPTTNGSLLRRRREIPSDFTEPTEESSVDVRTD